MQVERQLISVNESGVRVSNTYATYLLHRDSPAKVGLILDSIFFWHRKNIKDLLVIDGHASH